MPQRLQPHLCTEYAGEIRALLITQIRRIREAQHLYVSVKRQQQPSSLFLFFPRSHVNCAQPLRWQLLWSSHSSLPCSLEKGWCVCAAVRLEMTGVIHPLGGGHCKAQNEIFQSCCISICLETNRRSNTADIVTTPHSGDMIFPLHY